jgi:hypothetical protein
MTPPSRSIGPLLVGLLVGGLLGAGASWLAGGGDPTLTVAAQDRAVRAGLGDGSPRDDDRPAPASADSPLDVHRSDGALSGEKAPGEVLDRVASVARQAPLPASRRGDRAIRGHVADARGKPLAGVLVRATRVGDESARAPRRNEVGRAAPPPPSLEEAVRKAVEEYYERGADFRETTTDADGNYAFTELLAGRFTVAAWLEGFRLYDPNGAHEVRPDAKIDFIAKPVIAVPVEVTLPDGKSAAAALVAASSKGGNGGGESTGWTPQAATIALAPGTWEVSATLGDPQQGPPWPEYLASSKELVTIADGAAPPTVKLALKGEPGVRGRVLKPDGTQVQYAHVRLVSQPSGEPDLKRIAEDPDAKSAWAENGDFLFREVEPGRYVVATSSNFRNQKLVAKAVVEVKEGMVVQDLVLPELDPATCVVAKVTGPDGALLSEANFQWRVERDKAATGNQWQSDTAAERKEPGLWWLPLDSAANGDFDPLKSWPPQSRLFLITWTEGYGSTSIEIYQATRSVEVRFGPPATLLVTVPGYVQGEYVGRVRFQLDRAGEGAARFGWGGGGEPDKKEGVARIGPVEAGRYKLVMWVSDKGQERWQQSDVASQEVSLAAGENHVSMSIPTLYPLTVRMPAGSEGRLQLQSIGRTQVRGRQAGISKEGTATFGDLAPGDWRITWTGGTTPGVMNVSVPAGGVVDFAPMNVTALRVTVADASGRLVAAGLQDGDLVVAIEGKEITSYLDWQLLQTASRLKKEVVFTILRGTTRSDVTLEARIVNDTVRLGGTFEPATRG